MGNCLNAPSRTDYPRLRRRLTGYHSSVHTGLKCCQSSGQLESHGGELVLLRAQRRNRPSSTNLTIQTSGEGSGPLPTPRYDGDLLSSPHLKPFSLSELKNATRNFHPENLIREEEYGYVYKGLLDEQALSGTNLTHGNTVFVKKLKPNNQNNKEWLSEVTYLGQLRHPNLIKFIGYCLQSDTRLLVHEFMSKGSLQIYLFERNEPLTWDTRLKIAIGAARGISFLHSSDKAVIFREFRASNILLDSDFNVKIFEEYTNLSFKSPDSGWLNAKWDVYRFGVVLLELLTGLQDADATKIGIGQNLVEWVRFQVKDLRRFHRVMDSKLVGQYPRHGAWMAIALALQCLNNNAKLRPSMEEILTNLEEIRSQKGVFIDPSHLQALPVPPARSPPKTSHRSQSMTSLDQLSPDSLTPSGTPCLSPIRSPR